MMRPIFAPVAIAALAVSPAVAHGTLISVAFLDAPDDSQVEGFESGNLLRISTSHRIGLWSDDQAASTTKRTSAIAELAELIYDAAFGPEASYMNSNLGNQFLNEQSDPRNTEDFAAGQRFIFSNVWTNLPGDPNDAIALVMSDSVSLSAHEESRISVLEEFAGLIGDSVSRDLQSDPLTGRPPDLSIPAVR